MISDYSNVFKITWHSGFSLGNIEEVLQGNSEYPKRIITIAVQKSRICLMQLNDGALYFVPSKHENDMWVRLNERDIKVENVPDDIFSSEEKLVSCLERQMMLQFRTSVEGFYDDAPSKEDILNALSKNPISSSLLQNRFTFYLSDVEDDPEWDGVFEIHCSEGKILVPYVLTDESLDNARLLLEYQTFIPDSKLFYVTSGFKWVFTKLLVPLSNLHWSVVRRKLDEVWHK